MPWKECNRMDERLRFVARLLEGESMTAVCAAGKTAERPALPVGEKSPIDRRRSS